MSVLRCTKVGAMALALLVSGLVASLRAENWPRFRGPTGMGITTERGLPTVWGGKDQQNVLWRADLPVTQQGAKPDHNQSSPIVWEDRVVVTTAVWPADRKQNEIPDQHVTCYAAADGKQQWDVLVPAGPWKLGDLRGGYGAPTPVTDGQKVFVLFGSGVLAALDFSGQVQWRHDLADVQAFDVAIASSPIVYQDAVILLADRNNQKGALTAYRRSDGEVLWEQKRPQVAFDHSTPVVVELGGRPEMLIAASNALQGIDPATGEVRWWCDTPGDVCSPVFAAGLVYSDSGRGGPGMAVEPKGEGNLTQTCVKWRVSNIPEGLSSPAVLGEYLYRLHNPGVLKCFNLADGKEHYATRLDGVSGAASPIVTPEGNLYFASAGKSFVVRGGPKYELVATNDLGESSAASAAVSGGRMFLKGRDHLYCIGSKP